MTDILTDSLLPTPFKNLTEWLENPLSTYAAWTSSHPIEDSTRDVKNFMWGKWCRYLDRKRLCLDIIEFQHIADFFEAEEIAKAHRHRYVRMIERVYVHLSSLGLSIKNPGTHAAFHQLAKGANDPTVFLSEIEQKKVEKIIQNRLVHGVTQCASGDVESKENKKNRKKKRDWIGVRDAAVAAVMMGGGGTVWAAERLTVSCTNCSEGRISLPRKGGPEYEAIFLDFGQRTLDAWLRQRRLVTLSFGNTLFPADTGARRNPDTLTTYAGMSASSIFRAVQRVLHEAGITGARACGQTLRNTYGASLVRMGLSDEEILLNMGFFEISSAIRLRAAWGLFEQRRI